MRTLAVTLGLFATVGCAPGSRPSDSDTIQAVQDLTACTRPFDSVRVVRIALDTVDATHREHGATFQSAILRFEPDSAAGRVRIVTVPTPGQTVLDGMAVVLLDCDGRVFDLVLTDSA
jgi:hypothetical protein